VGIIASLCRSVSSYGCIAESNVVAHQHANECPNLVAIAHTNTAADKGLGTFGECQHDTIAAAELDTHTEPFSPADRNTKCRALRSCVVDDAAAVIRPFGAANGNAIDTTIPNSLSSECLNAFVDTYSRTKSAADKRPHPCAESLAIDHADCDADGLESVHEL